MKKLTWYERLVKRLGLEHKPREAHDAIKSTSKHERGRTKPKDYRRKRKMRRKMAKESRRINRERV